MANMCNDCGLPQELCACTDIERSEAPEVEISVEERRYDKEMTVIDGVSDPDLDEISSELKAAVGAGGTVEDGTIYIQGDHRGRQKVHNILEDYGYDVAT